MSKIENKREKRLDIHEKGMGLDAPKNLANCLGPN